MQYSFLSKVEDLGDVEREHRTALDDSLDFLEFAHDRRDFILETFVGDLAASQVDFVADENNRYLSSDDPETRLWRHPH